nr:retrovirus-related Pol polyprotein from transposon TNT 1-94 [Tanacetum cinerariifolium]
MFKQGDDPIDAINKMMSFLSTFISSRFPTTNNQLRNSSNPRQQATIHDGRVTVQPVQKRQSLFAAGTSRTRANISGICRNNLGQQRVVKCLNCQGEGHMTRQCPKLKRKRDATWFRIITTPNKVPLREPIPLEVVAQESVVTNVYTRRPKYLDFGCSKNMTRDHSQLTNLVHKFLSTVKFGNDQIAKITSINGKKYILVIVDYSEFTWVKFIASKDEASDFIIKFLKMIQVRLNTPVKNIRTDNGTEFVNQTLRSYYESVGISHKISVARSLQQNGIVERQNRAFVKAAQTIDDWDRLFQPMFDEYFNPPTIAVSLVPVVVTPRTIDLASSLVSTSIDQDAPSTSIYHHKNKNMPKWLAIIFDSNSVIILKARMKPKEPAYQVALDALALTACYLAFLVTAEVSVIYMHQFWATEDLAYQIDNIDSKKQDKMFFLRFTKIIIHYFLKKDKSISVRNKMFMHTNHDDSLLGTMRFVSRHADTQVYGAIIPKAMTDQALLDSIAYKTYYAISSGAEPPKLRKSQKKSDLAISYEESPFKKKYVKAKKVVAVKPKPTKKKASVKADRGKDEGTGTKPGVSDVPKYDSKNEKESWGDSGEEDDDDENDSKGENDNDANDDHNQEDDDTYDDNEETDKKIDDEETMDEEEDDEVTKELYNDVNVNLGNRDADMIDPNQVQSSSVFLEFTSKLLNLENPSLADNEIASLMETTVLHKEPRSYTSYLYTVPVTATPDVTSVFTTTIHPSPPFFNPLPQQATPTLTPTTSEATTSFPSLSDFSSLFTLNDRVTNLEKDLSEIKQVDEYAQALSSILAIVDCYINNKLGETVQKAIVEHNLESREEAQAEKRDYIDTINSSIRAILKEEVNTQLS